MPTNDFKVFAGAGGANVLSQASYIIQSWLTTGWMSGVLPSAWLNKPVRQASIISSMIAQFIVDETGGNAVDDGTIATLEAQFIAALASGTSGKLLAAPQIFTSNGTYTPIAGMKFCIIECLGGGASGGGTQATGVGESAAGGGGGAGAYAKGYFNAAAIGASKAVTVGASVTGTNGAAGTNGNLTAVGVLIAAGGGLAGALGLTNSSFVSSTLGGAQTGAPTGANIDSILGSAGDGGICYAATNCGGGRGGVSAKGQGGVTMANGNGAAAPNSGAGGAGAQQVASQAAATGGSGAGGRVIVWEYG